MQFRAHLVPALSVLQPYVYYGSSLAASDTASASYGLPYLPANAQSDVVPGVGALALSAAMLFTFQGARCAGCEPLTFIAFLYLLSTSIIIAAEPAKINCFLQFLLFK